VTVTAYSPAGAEVDAVSVTLLLAVVEYGKNVTGFGEKEAVTPAGSPEAVSWTGLLNPL
jgi:hypothetical protein